MSWTVDIHEDAWFALHLEGEHEALPEGDFKFEYEDKTFLIERKTWGDAYNSWRSNRLEDQLSRMLEKTPHSIILIEGRKESIYQSSPHVHGALPSVTKSKIFKPFSIDYQRKYALLFILTGKKILAVIFKHWRQGLKAEVLEN